MGPTPTSRCGNTGIDALGPHKVHTGSSSIATTTLAQAL
jgi:hypothetical protein